MAKNLEQDICGCCGQTTHYYLAIDKGTAEVLLRIARFIKDKGINVVHPRKEMEGIYLTSNQVGNLSRLRMNGLIAKVKGEDNAGNYCLTTKGLNFLKGAEIHRVALIRKSTSDSELRVEGHVPDDMVTLKDIMNSEDYWEGINYDIREGKVKHRIDSI